MNNFLSLALKQLQPATNVNFSNEVDKNNEYAKFQDLSCQNETDDFCEEGKRASHTDCQFLNSIRRTFIVYSFFTNQFIIYFIQIRFNITKECTKFTAINVLFFNLNHLSNSE